MRRLTPRLRLTLWFFTLATLLTPALAFAKVIAPKAEAMPANPIGADSISSRPLVLMIALAALGLAPFALMMVTSFVKISVVLSIVRTAMGTQQIPPTQVITGLAIILTVYIMAPVGQEMYRVADPDAFKSAEGLMSQQTVEQMLKEKATTVKSFTLYVVGEGIEKKVDDFAAEVAAQIAAAKAA